MNGNEIGIVQKTRTEYKYVASMKRRKGQTLFAFTPEDGKLWHVNILQEKFVDMDGKPIVRNRVTDYNPRAVYFYALNFPNALRKLRKLGFSDVIVTK